MALLCLARVPWCEAGILDFLQRQEEFGGGVRKGAEVAWDTADSVVGGASSQKCSEAAVGEGAAAFKIGTVRSHSSDWTIVKYLGDVTRDQTLFLYPFWDTAQLCAPKRPGDRYCL